MKNINTKGLFLLLTLCFFGSVIFAQSPSVYWKNVSTAQLAGKTVNRNAQPAKYQVFHLELDAFKGALAQAPLSDSHRNTSGKIMEFPMADGTIQLFEVTESSIMQPKLAAKYPMIKSYKAIGVDDKTATMRFSITPKGLHAISLSGQRSALYIDPYSEQGNNYMVYSRSELTTSKQEFECLTEENIDLKSLRSDVASQRVNTDDRTLRTYRLALSCNAEYGALFAGDGTDAQKKANILAQMNITINRVNEIYERDLAITLVFIDRNDELIYYDVNNDPWDSEFNTKTQQVISNTLNDESLYDIGHNFNTSNGGDSGCVGCVCVDAVAPFTADISKGRGYTGLRNPTGDAFDIDFVSHEIGHQFGAYHTMNTCARSGNGTSEVEPASGSSIMGYAGICSTNVQLNTDAHFNYVNIVEIAENIQDGGVSNCGAQTPLQNMPPVAIAGKDYAIPVSTAFVLRGEATDPDGTATLTYNWSQNDPERAPDDGAPQPTWTKGPLYRSILPTDSPDRYLPSLSDVVAGNLTPEWEVTPSVARTMNFALTVRDNGSGLPQGIGQVASDLMTVTVVEATPFIVTTPNTESTWYAGITREVTWEVGETNKAPISCEKVNIKLSVDGGLTYPITLASNVDNDGEETITVPDLESDSCRIMVEAADNIFYDISDANLRIEQSGPKFILEQEDEDATYQVCNNATFETIAFKYTTVSGFNSKTTFSATNLPTGVTASFEPASATTDTDVVLTLKNFDLAAIDVSDFNIVGTSAALTASVVGTLEVLSNQIETPSLISPANEATELAEDVTLVWEASEYATAYELEISTSSDFSAEVNRYQLTETQFDFQALETLTTYYWRVRGINDCASSTVSNAYSFTTSLCTPCLTTGIDNVPGLDMSITRVIFNTVDNASGKTGYSDFTGLENTIKRGESYPLSVYVNTSGDYTANTMVWIDWNDNCDFNDPGETYNLGAATNVSDGLTANSPLSITVPEDAILDERIIMRVSTRYLNMPETCGVNFDGEAEDYALIVGPTLGVEESNFDGFSLWPNPNSGSFTVSLYATSNNAINMVLYDVSGREVFTKTYQSANRFKETINLKGVASGLYVLEVNNGIHKTIRKVIIE